MITAAPQEAERIAEGLICIVQIPPKFHPVALSDALRKMLDEYSNHELPGFGLSGCLNETIEIIR